MGGQSPERTALQGLGRSFKKGRGYFVCELGGEGESLPGLGGVVLCGPDPVLFL